MRSSATKMIDLLPTGEELFQAAYGALVGDPGCISWGVHRGRNPDRRDTAGLTKGIVYQAALEGNMSFFTNLAERLEADPWTMPPSLRTYIPKDEDNPDKGVRPIDDPSECKRLISICVRHLIQEQAEDYLTTGQYGGRPEWAITKECTLPGATMQDHVATGIWKAIRKGYRHVLVLDLQDAFGLVPQMAVNKVLNRIGLKAEAARWVWRLCRIDAVDARNRHIQYTRQGRGIEQGNVLSALIMNLVLAPIIRCLENHLDVRVFAYLDDIYVLAKTPETAKEAFFRFRQSARDRGFSNVRRLKKDTDPADSKNSTIIDTEEQSVTVLKTYQVDGLGISLHADKVVKLRQEGKLSGKVTLSKLRKLSDCMSLTKAACRFRNSKAIRPAFQKPANNPCGNPSSPVEGTHGFIESRDKLNSPLECTDDVVPTRNNQNPDGPNVHDVQHRKSFPSSFFSTERENVMSSRCHGADGIPYYRDSHRPQGVTTPDRGQGNAGDCPAYLSLHWSDVQPSPFTPGRITSSNRYKGRLLDLTKISPAIGHEVAVGSIVQGVNRLIRAVRVENRAEVRIDPKEFGTALPAILGNADDTVYTRQSFKFQTDGTVIIVLVAQAKKRDLGRLVPVPSDADIVVRSIRAIARANNRYTITLVVNGKVRSECYEASSPNDMAGVLEVLAWVLVRFSGSVVAVPIDVAPLLEDAESIEPSNVGIRRALDALLGHWSWTIAGDGWLVGRRV